MDASNKESPAVGLWHEPEANYSFGLGRSGSLAATFGLVIVLIAFVPTANRIRNVSVVAAIVGVLLVGFIIRDRWGRNLYELTRFELGWLWHRASGRTFYSPVWFSSTPVSRSSMPGLMADVSVGENKAEDSQFGVVLQPVSKMATVVFECRPIGVEMMTDEEATQFRRRWDLWLSSVCQEPDLVSLQVVTQASAADSTQLSTVVEGLTKESASSEVSNALLRGIEEALDPSSRPVCRTWVAVAWRAPKREFHSAVLAARVGRIQAELAECGAGEPWPLTKNGIYQVWAEMWDPDRKESIARWAEQRIQHDNIVPAIKENRRSLTIGEHDAVTLAVGEMPSGVVGTSALHQLASGVPGATAVRWAELWRPVKPTEARTWLAGIERGVETRLALGQNRRRPRVQDEVDEAHHRTAAVALVEGANLVRFGLGVTATYSDVADRDAVIERVRQSCGPLAVQLRVHNGAHLPGFIATLPGGIPLPEAVQQPDRAVLSTDDARSGE